MLLLCEYHHRTGISVHGSSFATFVALLADKDDLFKIAISPEEYKGVVKDVTNDSK
jgi:hypothetical protein